MTTLHTHTMQFADVQYYDISDLVLGGLSVETAVCQLNNWQIAHNSGYTNGWAVILNVADVTGNA
jgi:hypothetical protein